MCHKVVVLCCHCGGFVPPNDWMLCNAYLRVARTELEQKPHLLLNPARCGYLSRPEVEPVLYGCENYSCISRSASCCIGFGDREDEKTREIAAWEYFTLYKKHFMKKYATRMPVVPRKQPQPFLLVARRASFEAMENDSDDHDEISDSGMPTGPMKRAPRTLGKYRISSRSPAFIDAAKSAASPDSDQVPLQVSDQSGDESDDDFEIADFKKRPRRMEQLRVPRFPAMVTRGNPLTIAYGSHAPKVPNFVTRAEIITKPFGTAAKAMTWIIDEYDAAKNASGFGRALGRVQTSISAKFAF
ncbi:hypothetical protein QQZ08_003171 [Neonectria magnoliae]|uniref:Uncharacterized protein n=1 Tax=Neonectria magnoliae TaxID=2732573 RepID=A0ABR1I9D7_9HYPO